MSLKDFFQKIDEEVSTVNSSDFDVEIIETKFVPSFDDPNITFDNLDTKKKKCKRLESCVLYIDIRNSAKISAERKPKTLAKMYSSFVRSMLSCARYYGGHVRNIIGDRVMVVFDADKCFTNAVNTAVLMNSVSKYILNKHIKSFTFEAGIGIDYGKMLITKSGAIRQGKEKEFYRSLVWLGKPANIASRLTDIANKTENHYVDGVSEMHCFGSGLDVSHYHWFDYSVDSFLKERITVEHPGKIKHIDSSFRLFNQKKLGPYKETHSPILMTEAVYKGFKSENPTDNIVKNNLITEKTIYVKDYGGKTYGGNVIFPGVKDI
jgi:adenylate cyclase